MTRNSPPSASELELSLFGPGVGECAVVHLGDGDWFIVDSCVDPRTKRPVALEYLSDLGVDVAGAVRGVVVTHWHDDHMRGAAEVLSLCRGATFFCSAALRKPEFLTLVAASSFLNMKSVGASGVEEFRRMLDVLEERREAVSSRVVGPEWAIADRVLFRRGRSGGGVGCEVCALSPSSAGCSRGLNEIAQLLPRVGEPKRAAVSTEPNEMSVVLSAQMGQAVALLGADLEASKDPAIGWSAVVACSARPKQKAQVFKVPHHGSETAHDDRVWEYLVDSDVVAVVTPFTRGRQSLPTPADAARLRARAGSVYCTSPTPGRAHFADPTVARTVREVALALRPRTGAMGQVRVRVDAHTGRPTVERFGAAFSL
jgi:beta-lactamase superfamily II metal-dependent hydrolase